MDSWPESGYKKNTHLGAQQQQHAMLTTNGGGSRKALVLAMETGANILLVQEHRLTMPSPPGGRGSLWEDGGMEFGMQLQRIVMYEAAARLCW